MAFNYMGRPLFTLRKIVYVWTFFFLGVFGIKMFLNKNYISPNLIMRRLETKCILY